LHTNMIKEHAPQTAPLTLRAGCKQLFLDDHLIATARNVRRTMHEARKDPQNPLLLPDKPWESQELLLFGSVIHEPDGRWRMWYMNHHHEDSPTPDSRNRRHGVGYAESKDGITWHKPEFNFQTFRGKPTNIVLGTKTHETFREFHGVIRDDSDPDPARRYKTFFHSIDFGLDGTVGGTGRWYFTACSPDGIHWGDVRQIEVANEVNPDIGQFTYDPIEKRYVIWARSRYASDAVRARAPKGWFGRAVNLLTSKDFIHWEDHGVAMAADLDDPPAMDIYSMAAFRYGDLWVGLPQVYHQQPDNHALDIQLACSRNGIDWTRLMEHKAILPLGDIGEWDRFNHNTATELVAFEDELRLYYSGRTYRHGGYKGPDTGHRFAGIGLARWRMDGFVSMDASFDEGVIETKLVCLNSADLRINAKADYGTVEIEVLDSHDNLIARSLPITEDRVNTGVEWDSKHGQGLPDRTPIRLRFRLRNAQLYAFWCD
jgi:hypothetical protein